MNQDGNWEVYRPPPSWVQTEPDNFGKVTHEVAEPYASTLMLVVVYFGGYRPTDAGVAYLLSLV